MAEHRIKDFQSFIADGSSQRPSKEAPTNIRDLNLGIRVLTSRNGMAKFAQCDAPHGSGATATFVRERLSLLSGEIQQARSYHLRLVTDGNDPTPEQIAQQFPEQIGYLCTEREIRDYVVHQGTSEGGCRVHFATPFRHLLDSILRMGRDMSRYRTRRNPNQKKPRKQS